MIAQALVPRRLLPAILLASAAACGSSAPPPTSAPAPSQPPAPPVNPPAAEPAPKLRLPADTKPTAEAIELHIDPTKPRFSGQVDLAIDLAQPRRVIWLHGRGFHVSKVSAQSGTAAPMLGDWKEHDKNGTASISLPNDLPVGPAKLHIEFDRAFGTSDAGLSTLTAGGDAYAFTQFEEVDARAAFPCFDEPGFKIPFDVTLVVPKGDQAISNGREIDRKTEGDALRVHFATTKPLPSYLVAFAVGPLDVVNGPDVPANAFRKQPLPLRGVAVKGRGKDLAYTLAHAGGIVATLEGVFGLPYPYDKLDLIAVPAKPGAMENAGAITFSERLLLFGDNAPLELRRGFASVVAHEVAHQWTGDLVTAAWWDDIWLNEAFATWIAAIAAERWDAKLGLALYQANNTQNVMGTDALGSARQIRQPITSYDDIQDAFDGITYQKGAAVLAMFEHWAGSERFLKGLHEYLAAHAYGNATADDFLAATSAATDKDIKTPFHTFLDQPGVPFVETEVACQGPAVLKLKQSRFTPLGSIVDPRRTWQVPVCARYATGKTTHEACTLLTAEQGELALGDKCPDWVLPNADATGYYRFASAAPDLAKLTKGYAQLTLRDRMAYANSVRAAYLRGTGAYQDLVTAARRLASEPTPLLAGTPMAFLNDARSWLRGDPAYAAVERYGRDLYRPAYQQVGWQSAKADSADKISLRVAVVRFFVEDVRDPAARAEAKKRGLAYLGTGDRLHPEAVDANLVPIALGAAGEDAPAALWDRVHDQLAKTDDTEQRRHLLEFLVANRRPELAPKILGMSIDHSLRPIELLIPLYSQIFEPETRDPAWAWAKAHFSELLAALAEGHRQAALAGLGGEFCDDAHIADYQQFMAGRLDQIEGVKRPFAQVSESQQLCLAKRKAHEASARKMFGAK
ncbi:MAG TPA: M1 family metallopeptidase [Kofleriaceae bacterium]|nr:M1 family metallopeptidase [Kofleriaceae bacterium]